MLLWLSAFFFPAFTEEHIPFSLLKCMTYATARLWAPTLLALLRVPQERRMFTSRFTTPARVYLSLEPDQASK